MYILITSIVIGIILGLIGGPVWILVPWGVAAIIIGYFSRKGKAAIINGAVFAFLTSFIFLVKGYTGVMHVYTKFPGFFALSLFGALLGLIASFGGYIIYKGIQKSKSKKRG